MYLIIITDGVCGHSFTSRFVLQAVGIRVHPVYILLPAAVACSFAFMLPVGTPPNTIAFSYGYLKVFDMVSFIFILLKILFSRVFVTTGS